MNGTKGVVLMIWGDRAYGYAARNFAISIRYHNPDLPIFLITDEEALKGITYTHLFEKIRLLPVTPIDPALCKMQIYDKLPYDHNLFLDVDALCVASFNDLWKECTSSEKEYRVAVNEIYDKDSPEKFPQMYWADKSIIWNHYGFTDEKLPATQSSIQYIRRGEFCASLFNKMGLNYANKIPVEKLRNKWGGGQPDELYLNITLAQMNYDPTLNGFMYFGNDLTKKFNEIAEPILSMFGTAANIKPKFINGYDKLLSEISPALGAKHIDWKHIATRKIANKRTNVMSKNNGLGRSAFVKRFFREQPAPDAAVKGEVHLYVTNLYPENTPQIRINELMECHRQNCANPSITKIFNYGNLPYEHPKVENISIEKRATYQFMFDEANKRNADYVIISNSDLYFDKTINWIDKVDLTGVMLALCRYNFRRGRAEIEAYSWSQGTWIFKGPINLKDCDYEIGLPGCENRLAYEAVEQGYSVKNPAKDIKCYHLHDSDFRTYTQEDRIAGNYMPVLISSVLEIPKVKRILIDQRGALGDIICVLPIAKYYADRGYLVDWLCPMQFHHLFNYIDYATPVTAHGSGYEKVIDLSFGIDHRSANHREWIRRKPNLDSFVTFKYELAGVPLSELRKLQYSRNEKRETGLFEQLNLPETYSLVHDNSSYSVEAETDLPIIKFRPIEGYSIFDWRKVIEGASEIHCIDSCLLNFVDGLMVDAKLYFYRTERHPEGANLTLMSEKWEVREYAVS